MSIVLPICIGIVTGIILIWANEEYRQREIRKLNRQILETRLELEVQRNGRENGDLTVKIDPV